MGFRLQLGCQVLLEERVELAGKRTRFLTQVEVDRYLAHLRQDGGLASVEATSRLFEQARRVAEDQRPRLGTQVKEMDVIFRGEAISTESMQRLRHCTARSIGIPPRSQGDFRGSAGVLVCNVAQSLPSQVFAAINIAE